MVFTFHVQIQDLKFLFDKEPNRRIRQIKEVIWITKTPVNRDEDNYELPTCTMTSFVLKKST